MQVATCDCEGTQFEGFWIPPNNTHSQRKNQLTHQPNERKTHRNSKCNRTQSTLNAKLSDEKECVLRDSTNSTLISKTFVCPGFATRVVTASGEATFEIQNGIAVCLTANVSKLALRQFARPTNDAPFTSLVKAKQVDAHNIFSVVENEEGYLVGQIASDVIAISLTYSQSGENEDGFIVAMRLCMILLVDGDEVYDEFEVMDLGYSRDPWAKTVTFRPLGLEMVNGAEDEKNMRCFELNMTVNEMYYVLIWRLEEYESYSLLSESSRALLITSAVLYGLGCVFVFASFVALYVCMNTLGVAPILLQCILLMSVRCVYSSLVVAEKIDAGTMVDYVLFEIPTFFYFQILIQIVVAFYVQIRKRDGSGIPRKKAWAGILLCWVCLWVFFAAVVIGISNSSLRNDITPYCEWRLSDVKQPSQRVRYIRITYKSIIASLALLVFGIMFGLGLKVDFRKQMFVTQIILVSLFLVLDCIAFVIYYWINKPTAYFVIVLWATELFPLVLLSGWLCKPGLVYLKANVLSTSRKQMDSTRTH
jgi:hypothetical protein